MIINIPAVLGIVFIIFCICTAFAVFAASGDYENDPEEDAEQAEYIKEWIKRHDSH